MITLGPDRVGTAERTDLKPVAQTRTQRMGTIKSRLFNARLQLRRRLSETLPTNVLLELVGVSDAAN